MRVSLRSLALSGLLLGIAACGRQEGPISPTPSYPPPSFAIPDFSGTWTTEDGTRTWTLSQVTTNGITSVGGNAVLSDSNHPTLGVASGKGGVNGIIFMNTFMFGEYFPDLGRTPGGACYSENNGSASVSGDTLTVGVVEKTGCTGSAGTRFPDMARLLTMRRK